MVQTVLRTIEILQWLVGKVVDAPVMQVVQVSLVFNIPVETQRQIPMIRLFSKSQRFPSRFSTRSLMSLLCGSCRFSGVGCEETVVLPQLQL